MYFKISYVQFNDLIDKIVLRWTMIRFSVQYTDAHYIQTITVVIWIHNYNFIFSIPITEGSCSYMTNTTGGTSGAIRYCLQFWMWPNFPPFLGGVHIAQSLVFCVVFY